MIASLSHVVAGWARLYGDQKMLSASVTFVHLAGVLGGGGLAIAADRGALRLTPDTADINAELARLGNLHRWIIAGLAVTIVSGVLMMLADLPTFLPSVLFWTKIGLLVLLLANGTVRLRAERALLGGRAAGWRPFRLTSAVSLVLWFGILLAGSFLPTLSDRGTRMTRHLPDAPDACDSCPLLERRTFLRDATIVLAGIVAGLGGTPGRAGALSVTFARSLHRAGQEHSYPIPAEDGATIDRDAEVIVVRYQQKVYAFSLSCPHQHTALRWQPEDNQFQCPKHHSRYRPDGAFVSGRATRSMDRFGVRRDGANIVADLDKYYRQDSHAAEWEAAFVAL